MTVYKRIVKYVPVRTKKTSRKSKKMSYKKFKNGRGYKKW